MSDQVNSVSRRWRRFLRVSVRGLIILVLFIGVWFGWLVRCARIQRDAVAAIKSAGGSAKHDWESVGYHGVLFGDPPAPRWLSRFIGVDYFGHVTESWFGYSATDAQIAPVAQLDRLEKLWLHRTQVTDAGLAHLKGLTKLRSLDLGGTRVSDAGLAHLKRLTKLEILNLSDTQVTDIGLAHLTGLTKLEILNLSETTVTDAGLVHLIGLTKLSELDLRGTRVTDAGLVYLKGLAKLSTLFLGSTQVTDDGVKGMKQALRGLGMDR